MRGCRALALASGLCLATWTLGCQGDYRRELDDGFPNDLIVDSEQVLASALLRYHMSGADAACVARHAFKAGTVPAPPGLLGDHTVTTEQLDEAAQACNVDLSKLWYTTD